MSIVRGVVATLACAVCFYLAGLAMMPGRWTNGLAQGIHAGLAGAAVYVLVCWTGVSFGVPLLHSTAAFAAAVAALCALRYRHIAAAVRELAAPPSARYALVAFLALYTLAYVLTLPPVTSTHLPVAWTGNLDLMTYARYTKYLLHLGRSNLPEFTYLNFIYLQTPGVFYMLGALSLAFGRDPLSATMAAQFGLTALIGVAIAGLSHSVFHLSRRAGLTIACVVVSGPFFRYIAQNYFLSTLMATPVMLYTLAATLDARQGRLIDVPLAVRLAACYILLLFIYPFLLFATIAAQAAAVGLMLIVALIRRREPGEFGAAIRHAQLTFATAASVAAVLTVAFWSRLNWSADMVLGLSEAGVAGWPLDMIAPRAMLAIPGTTGGALQVAPEDRAVAIAVLCAIAVGLVLAYGWGLRNRSTPAQRTLIGLAAGALIAYCACFAWLGPSYQQWKFASYSVMPLSFVIFAGALHVWRSASASVAATRSPSDRLLLDALPGYVAVALIAGNIAVHAARDPGFRVIPASLRAIEEIDKDPDFRELSVRMQELPDQLPTWVALYYLPNKRVHIVSSAFQPNEPLSLELVSRYRPLFLHNYGCEGIGHDDTVTIGEAGCLVFSPPSPRLDVVYPFNRTFLFMSYDGLTGREEGGRWNARPMFEMKVTADPTRAPVDKDLFLNLSLSPSLPAGVERQRLVVTWPHGDRADIALAEREWISLPVRSADWEGDRLRILPLTLEFSDRRTILFHELSVSATARGRRVERTRWTATRN